MKKELLFWIRPKEGPDLLAQFCGALWQRDLVAFNAKPYLLRLVSHYGIRYPIACEKGESSCSSTVKDRNEFLGRSKTAIAKPLLSNEWETYIHHVDKSMMVVIAVYSNKKLEGYSRRVYASRCKANGCFVIRKLNNVHTCTSRIRESKSKMMRSRVVSSLFVDRIRAKLELKPVEIIHEFKDYYGIDISYYHAWFGKELAKMDVHGDELKSFNELSKYKGQLFCASRKNGNQGFYPLAFGVIDSEIEENWTWFLQHLAAILLLIGRMVTFFSDRNQNLISKYLKSAYGKLLQDCVINLFSRCTYVVMEDEFKVAMDELVIVGSSKVKKFIADLSRDHYAKAFFKGIHYGEMANSLAKSFNNWVGVFRDLSVLPLIEWIRHKLMVLNSQRRIEAEKWTTILCPDMETKLWENTEALMVDLERRLLEDYTNIIGAV
ncbi:EF-TU receptor [Prunus dulcis]|uniref:EF-TU receptor n=1 Tax=Prunus dulcis TaxID=3755 RepID=A0A5H2XM51_PRUDU|nr:EF-TU receptor [Prunus dulcis]